MYIAGRDVRNKGVGSRTDVASDPEIRPMARGRLGAIRAWFPNRQGSAMLLEHSFEHSHAISEVSLLCSDNPQLTPSNASENHLLSQPWWTSEFHYWDSSSLALNNLRTQR